MHNKIQQLKQEVGELMEDNDYKEQIIAELSDKNEESVLKLRAMEESEEQLRG